MSQLNIICTQEFRECAAQHKRYQMDLGRLYTKRSNRSIEVDIRDAFVLKIYKSDSKLIYKCGRLGAITLYTFADMPEDEVWFYKDDMCYVRPFDANEMSLHLERYLSKLIASVEEEANGTDKLD